MSETVELQLRMGPEMLTPLLRISHLSGVTVEGICNVFLALHVIGLTKDDSVKQNPNSALDKLPAVRAKRKAPEIAQFLPDDWVDTEAAAKFLGIRKRTLENWRGKGIGPKWKTPIKPDKKVMYRQSDVTAWSERGE